MLKRQNEFGQIRREDYDNLIDNESKTNNGSFNKATDDIIQKRKIIKVARLRINNHSINSSNSKKSAKKKTSNPFSNFVLYSNMQSSTVTKPTENKTTDSKPVKSFESNSINSADNINTLGLKTYKESIIMLNKNFVEWLESHHNTNSPSFYDTAAKEYLSHMENIKKKFPTEATENKRILSTSNEKVVAVGKLADQNNFTENKKTIAFRSSPNQDSKMNQTTFQGFTNFTSKNQDFTMQKSAKNMFNSTSHAFFPTDNDKNLNSEAPPVEKLSEKTPVFGNAAPVANNFGFPSFGKPSKMNQGQEIPETPKPTFPNFSVGQEKNQQLKSSFFSQNSSFSSKNDDKNLNSKAAPTIKLPEKTPVFGTASSVANNSGFASFVKPPTENHEQDSRKTQKPTFPSFSVGQEKNQQLKASFFSQNSCTFSSKNDGKNLNSKIPSIEKLSDKTPVFGIAAPVTSKFGFPSFGKPSEEKREQETQEKPKSPFPRFAFGQAKGQQVESNFFSQNSASHAFSCKNDDKSLISKIPPIEKLSDKTPVFGIAAPVANKFNVPSFGIPSEKKREEGTQEESKSTFPSFAVPPAKGQKLESSFFSQTSGPFTFGLSLNPANNKDTKETAEAPASLFSSTSTFKQTSQSFTFGVSSQNSLNIGNNTPSHSFGSSVTPSQNFSGLSFGKNNKDQLISYSKTSESFATKPFATPATSSMGNDVQDTGDNDNEEIGKEEATVVIKELNKEEECLLDIKKSKLFQFNKIADKWIDRGVHPLEILKNKLNGKSRILMRNQIGKIILNAAIYKDMNIQEEKKKGTTNVSLILHIDNDLTRVIIRVKEEFRDIFIETLTKCSN